MKKCCVIIFSFLAVVSYAQQSSVQSDAQALAIIKNVIRLKSKNNPQKKLDTYEFESYTRLIVTANPDSISGKIDTIRRRKFLGKRFKKVDSTEYKFKKIVERQHLFQTESVSQFQFDGTHLKETVLATKMSGFRKPIYEALGLNLQSYSVYDENYELFETQYHSPVSRFAAQDYQFSLLDSVNLQGRKTYKIYFKNNRKQKSAGLEGVLYIDSENFAIAKAEMRIKGLLDIRGTHHFEYFPEQQLWFATGRTFKIAKGNNDEDIRILGGTIKFDGADGNPDREKEASDFTYLLSETNHTNIRFNGPVAIRKRAISIQVRTEATQKPDDFWASFRKDSLDVREQNTYRVLDSLAYNRKIESKLRVGRKVINGYIPFGAVDLDLRYLLSFNNYEGFRLGLGGVTNDKFSEKYRLEGFAAYGTKDGTFKYHFGGAARVGNFSDSWIGGSYTNDVREIASTTFTVDKRVFKLYDPRPINISTFYNHETYRAFIETKIIPKTESIWQLAQSAIAPKFNYAFNANDRLYEQFNLTTAMVSLQWNPFSDYMQTPEGRIEIEKRFPKFTVQFTQTLPSVFANDFNFGKIDFRGDYEKKYVNGQKTAIVFEFGLTYGDVPITHLYNTSPNNLTKDRLLQRITLSGKNSFETMYFNEFFSSEFAMLQLKHGFSKVPFIGKIKPTLVFVTRMAWGNMQKPQQHVGLNYKTLNEGYFESGMELNQIFKGFGLSGFYRYGPNQLARFEDNLAVKISFILNIGL